MELVPSAGQAQPHAGRRVFGAAVLGFGVIALVWPDYYDWLQLAYVSAPTGRIFCYAASAAQIVGGAGLLFDRTARAGAVFCGVAYLAMSLLSVPQIVASPRVYAPWGDFFIEFSLAAGAGLAYAERSSAWRSQTLAASARILFGIFAASDAAYQAFYPGPTAALVPTWFPPSQMFWTGATTVFFGLAALALVTDRLALLATRLQTLMLVVFGLVVWVPLVATQPQTHFNWTETAENFVIAGATWLVVDLLRDERRYGP